MRKNLNEWLDWIVKQSESIFKSDPNSLQRIAPVAQKLGLLPVSYRVITVAGTNGKGSTVALLAQLYRQAGYQVGHTCSPHLVCYNERISINGQPVDDGDIISAFEAIASATTQPLSYYDYAYLAALILFSKHTLDLVIFETGMGGRHDCSNLLDADALVLTNVALDHCHILGDTIEKIGAEKAGLMRSEQAVFYAMPTPPQSVQEQAKHLNAQVYPLDLSLCESLKKHYRNLVIPINNIAAALTLVAAWQAIFPVSEQIIEKVLTQFFVPGRLHLLPFKPGTWIADVAHNPHAAGYLATYLNEHTVQGKTYALYTSQTSKDSQAITHAVDASVNQWCFLPQIDNQSAYPQRSHLTQPVALYSDLDAAMIDLQTQLTAEDRVIIFGSCYLVGAVLQLDRNQ